MAERAELSTKTPDCKHIITVKQKKLLGSNFVNSSKSTKNPFLWHHASSRIVKPGAWHHSSLKALCRIGVGCLFLHHLLQKLLSLLSSWSLSVGAMQLLFNSCIPHCGTDLKVYLLSKCISITKNSNEIICVHSKIKKNSPS